MKITFLPKTNLGKWTVGLIVGFFVFLTVFFLLIELGERGGETIFSNLKLTIPYFIAVFLAIASFVVGIISVIKKKERSILVFLSIILGFLILLWVLAVFVFPE